MYYVYLHSPCGTELIAIGTKEQCEVVKAEKEAKWQIGDMWSVEITDKRLKESSYWD